MNSVNDDSKDIIEKQVKLFNSVCGLIHTFTDLDGDKTRKLASRLMMEFTKYAESRGWDNKIHISDKK